MRTTPWRTKPTSQPVLEALLQVLNLTTTMFVTEYATSVRSTYIPRKDDLGLQP